MNFKGIKKLQLEISSNCNAACPQCPRNHYGGKTIGDLPLINWSLDDVKQILDVDFVKQLELIYFCGTYGDPMFNKKIIDICQWLKSINPMIKLSIHTNGSLGSPQTFQQLACIVDFIAFGIDGLQDTNHLYRRNTNWKKIISNAKAFIDNQGTAYWDFIVFKHNQHQVTAARELSDNLGFAQFNVKKTSRFFNKEHKLVPHVDVYDNKFLKIYKIEPPSTMDFCNKSYKTLDQINLTKYSKNTQIICYHLQNNEIYIGADGFVFPCGWLHDRLYGTESEKSLDRPHLLELLAESGGADVANCFKTPLRDIVNGAWFATLKNSWNHSPLERCVIICGGKNDLIKEQNEFVQYT